MRVVSDSMGDTLVAGDILSIEPLGNVFLHPLEGDRKPISLDSFTDKVRFGDICVLSMSRSYMIKRV